MNNIFFKTLFKKGAKGAKGEKGTSYEVPTNGIIGFDDEDGELDIPAGYDDATIPPYLIKKIIRTNGEYSAESEGAFGYSEVDVNIASTPTLISKTITENGTYDPTEEDADGYLDVTVNVSGGGGESIDGLYFDGTTTNNLRPPFYAEDYEIEVNFYTPSYQSNCIIFGTTANGYYPICFMIDNAFRVNGGNNNQVNYTPSNFEGDHTLILNRLNDRAIVFDGNNIGTYGTNNFSNTVALDIGKSDSIGLSAAEFVLNYLKITDYSTGEVLADYRAGFRYLKNGYKIPCLLNTIDGAYIDLNTGRSSGNNEGHIMLCQHTNDNYAWYYNQDRTLVVRQKLSDNSFRWYFNDYNIQGADAVPANLQRFILNNVGARAGIAGDPAVVGFYDNTIRGWTPTLGYNVTGVTQGIIESTDVNIDYDNYHEWVAPTFDPING